MRDADYMKAPAKTKISAQELEMSSALVDQFRGDFNPEEFEDDYHVELRTLIEEKFKQGDSLDTEATLGDRDAAAEESGPGGGNVLDLMEALKRSVDQKRARSDSPEPAKKAVSPASPTNKSADKPPAKAGKSGQSGELGKKKPAAESTKSAASKKSPEKKLVSSSANRSETAARKGA